MINQRDSNTDKLFREEVINVELARLLNKYGLNADPETITSGRLPDVMIIVDGVKINLEGRFTKSPDSTSLEKDCIKRLEEGMAEITVGLYYPEDIKKAKNLKDLSKNLTSSLFNISIFYFSDQGLKKYKVKQIGIQELVTNLNNIYNIVLKSDVLKKTIEEVGKTIEKCSVMASENNLFFSSEKLIAELRKNLGIKKSGIVTDAEKKQIIQISIFILFDTLVFHEALSTTIINIISLKKKDKEEHFQSFISKEWDKILKIDFIPIFLIAKDILLSLPSSIVTEKILKELSEQAVNVLRSGVLLKHDLMGRSYHKLLLKSTGEFYATYYTSIPAAWILANLSIKTNDLICNSLEEIKKIFIIDPACGSGTLLSASYNAIRDRYIIESKNPNLKEFHKIMMENVIHGWDVLDYAGHLTLTSLALHNYKSFFDKPNIHILPVGLEGKELYLGSLDYLEPQQKFFGKDFFRPPKRRGITKEFIEDPSIKTREFNLVIMNPPFSRSAGLINTKFGYEEEKIKKELNKYLSDLGKKFGLAGVGQAGLGAYFIALGDSIINKEGKIAVVIPRAILSGTSWQKIRDILFNKYEVEYIVSNHDPGDKENQIDPWSFSENTKLSEVLIVASKSNKKISDKYTTIVNIWNKPKNEFESLIVSSKSIKSRKRKSSFIDKNESPEFIRYSQKTVGCIYNLSQEYLGYNFLFPSLFANPNLNSLVFKLLFENKIPVCPLESLSNSLGVDRKQISTNFKLSDITTPHSILWGHPISIDSIDIKKESLHYVELETKESLSLLNSSANLLVAEHLFLNNNKVVSVFVKQPSLSTAFWEVKLEEPISKILTLWFNSTLGFILLLSNSISSYGQQINLKKGQLEKALVFDPRKLKNEDIDLLLNFYNEVKNLKFERFPQEFLKAFEGLGTRKKIDDFFKQLLRTDINLKPFYKMLAEEPIISGNRF